MDYLNPMLNDPYNQKSQKPTNRNVRNQPVKERKTRSDKKRDIKIPLTLDERRKVLWLSQNHNMNRTNFCTLLVQQGLSRNFEYPEVLYKDSHLSVHVKLNEDFYNLLSHYVVKWDTSARQAAHRILMYMLQMYDDGGGDIESV